MSFIRRLYYYFIAMRRLPLVPVPCGQCGRQSDRPFLRIDRYLLPVEFSVCAGCGLVHTSRNMAGETLQQFYRDHYRRYYENVSVISNGYMFSHKHKVNAGYRLLRIRELVPHFTSVLEIGSGLGCFLDECRHAGVQHLFGLELGDTFRQYASQQLGLGDQVRAQPFETIDRLPFAPDLVVLFHVFEHLEDPAGCLQFIAQHMAADGTLVIEVPDIAGDWSELGLIQFHTAHRWYFSPVTLSNLLAQNGFTPYFITRDDADGIYPGNLRIFARRETPPDFYPLPEKSVAEQVAFIRAQLPLGSFKKGLPRMALRLVKQALRG